MEIKEILKIVKSKLNPKIGVNGIYKAKRGYIVSTYLIDNPDEPLDDCLFILENDMKTFREYGITENPKELTEAISKIENILYSRKK